jgi:myo-inositol-1(or 4)-monophosphatase
MNSENHNTTLRLLVAEAMALRAGMLALQYFRSENLTRMVKGPQDFVSEADRKVEVLIRETITALFPDDGILGEEDGYAPGTSGYTWVVDPIDGTAAFLDQLPGWVVSVAILKEDVIEIGVVHDPCGEETFTARRGKGAFLNGRRLPQLSGGELSSGTVGIGVPRNGDPDEFAAVIGNLLRQGGNFYRNGSAASMLAQVAAGRLFAAYQSHLSPWDCLAGVLLVEEAGGELLGFDMEAMLNQGGEVLGTAPGGLEQFRKILLH